MLNYVKGINIKRKLYGMVWISHYYNTNLHNIKLNHFTCINIRYSGWVNCVQCIATDCYLMYQSLIFQNNRLHSQYIYRGDQPKSWECSMTMFHFLSKLRTAFQANFSSSSESQTTNLSCSLLLLALSCISSHLYQKCLCQSKLVNVCIEQLLYLKEIHPSFCCRHSKN